MALPDPDDRDAITFEKMVRLIERQRPELDPRLYRDVHDMLEDFVARIELSSNPTSAIGSQVAEMMVDLAVLKDRVRRLEERQGTPT